MSGKHKGKKPSKSPDGPKIEPFGAAGNHNDSTPRWCMKHLQRGFSVSDLEPPKRSDFAEALEKRAKMTWKELLTSDRHGLGMEKLPRHKIRAQVPPYFEGLEHFMVFRYSAKRPMVGHRTNDTFHIFWIEREFGELYDHGS